MSDLMDIIMGSTVLITCLVAACTAVPFLGIAAFLFYRARQSKAQADSSQNWPSVLGVIVNARLEARRSSDSRGGTSTSYFPYVQYEYEVLGHRYQSDRVSFGAALGSGIAGTMQAVVDRYVPGNQVRVYYNPDNPGEAVLERSAGSGSKYLTWVAVFILVMLIGSLCVTVIAVLVPMLAIGEIFRNIPMP